MAKWNLDERGVEWRLKPIQGKTAASGSLINMYDGSQRQVQDIEVGDVVKSYQPLVCQMKLWIMFHTPQQI